MARSKEFDKNLVLHKAMEVFGHYGYEGASLPILLDGLGIARQSLYDTYGTKKDLFIQAVKHYLDEKSSAVVVRLEKSESVKEAIQAIFREIVLVLQDADRRKECFILHSAIDQVPHEPEIAALFQADQDRLERAFYEALVRAKQRQELNTDRDLHALARYLYHSRYALTQVAKLTSHAQVLDEIAAVALSTLEA